MAWLKISDENGGTYVKEAEVDPVDLATINNLNAQITDLENMTLGLPPLKTEPDQETLEFWNEMNDQSQARSDIQAQIDEKSALIAELEGLSG